MSLSSEKSQRNKKNGWLSHDLYRCTHVNVFHQPEHRIMTQSMHSVGVHVILVPRSEVSSLPRHRQSDLVQIATDTAVKSGCIFKSLHVGEDHMHVLIVSADEQAVNTFLPEFAERSAACIIGDNTDMRGFEWGDRIHVTLLPPWHVEILASFVRDQDSFHKTRTLQQELDEIFMPNALISSDLDAQTVSPSSAPFH